VSGFAGRRVYLERSKSSELTRGLDQHRARVIEQLYAAQRPAAARTIADAAGIEYAIIRPQEKSRGLKLATIPVYSFRGAELRKFPEPGE
ncbi:MAG: hypothetical protein HY876_02210, partial [Coriobacteriales bacterium]|nr:hypothetical protein [Coriobacteriales bacterium]